MNASTADTRQYLQYLRSLGEETADPVEGFFGPDSVLWKVSRQRALYLGGMRALLMQIAHPKVAQGVADHSRFRENPFARAFGTFHAVHAIIFGTPEVAIQALARVHAIHTKVRGRLSEPTPAISDPAYEANDPHLLFWVYATLVDSSLYAYDTFLSPLSAEDREQFYQESKLSANLLGIKGLHLPEKLVDFRQWMEDTIASDVITVTPTARQVANALLKGPPLLFLFRPGVYVFAAGTLPPKLREAFGLKWNLPVHMAYAVGVRAIRVAVRCVPPDLRVVPAARRAERRCRVGAANRR